MALPAGLALARCSPRPASPVAAADPIVLRMGTTQAIDSLNPYQAALVESYEAFELTYDQLVGFGPNLEPIPAFAESWARARRRQVVDVQVPAGPEVVRRPAGDLGRRLLLVAAQPRRDQERT